MKFHFALLFVLCALALARDESIKIRRAPAKPLNAIMKHSLADLKMKRDSFFRPTPKDDPSPADSVAVAKKRNGTSIMSSCSSGGGIDEITVGVKRILAKNGVEFVYGPMDTDVLANCFESYNNTILNAPDLISCCDAAAAGGYNSFRFNGSVCTGYKAWLPVLRKQCYGEAENVDGFFVAKKKVSKFTPRAPTFDVTAKLGLSRFFVHVKNITIPDQCPFSKTLKITTYSRNESFNLEFVNLGDGYHTYIYVPELCEDNAPEAKRTVTVSILDSDGSVLNSVKKVPSSDFTGRHLTSNGLCVQYITTDPLGTLEAEGRCFRSASAMPMGTALLSFTDLLRQINGLNVGATVFWSGAQITSASSAEWMPTGSPIDMSLFNSQSVADHFALVYALVNVTDGLMYAADSIKQHNTVCVDAPYYDFNKVFTR